MYETNNNFYKNLSEDILLTNVSHLDIPFITSWNKIGVNLSGGASAVDVTLTALQLEG